MYDTNDDYKDVKLYQLSNFIWKLAFFFLFFFGHTDNYSNLVNLKKIEDARVFEQNHFNQTSPKNFPP